MDRRILLGSAAAAVIALGAVTPSAVAFAPHTNRPDAVGTHFATLHPACAAPSAGHFSCFAIRRTSVPAGTPEATSYTVQPGVSYGPDGGYTPADLATAYGVSADGGKGQTVAIVDAYNDPSVRKDLATFDAHYKLPAETPTSFRVLNGKGKASPLPEKEPGWSGEISLDVQAVRGMCRQCNIILIEAASNSTADLAAGVREAAKLHATEISNSYGGPETQPDVTHQVIASYRQPKTVVVASSGDDGWYFWDILNQGSALFNAPNVPAALPTVVSVGGTTLSLDNRGDYAGEQVWNRNGPDDVNGSTAGTALGASGGGCSTRFAATPWQRDVAGWAATGCGTHRLAADVSVVGDPDTGYDVYQSYGLIAPQWVTYGGTSLSAPLVAAMYALAGGSHGVAYPSLTLYGHPHATHDITIGGNGFCDGDSPTHCFNTFGENPNQRYGGLVDCAFGPKGRQPRTAVSACDAVVGYDGPSGVGTPSSLALFRPVRLHVRITARRVGRDTYRFATSVTDPTRGGANQLTSVWDWGDGTPRTTAGSPTHRFHGKQHVRVRVEVKDAFGQSGITSKQVTLG